MSTIENIVKSLAYATEHNQGLHLTHEEVPALNACIAELERRAARAKELLQDEMGDWLTVEAIYMPDHYLQLKQTIDVLDGGGE